MTVLNPTGQSKKERKLSSVMLFVILLSFVIGAVVTAKNQTFTEHSAFEDVNGLMYALQSIANGDVSGFVDGLFAGIPIIGLFLVMYTILYFLFSVTLAKLFNGRSGVATTLSLVLSVYAFINNTIYNYMLSLNAFAIAFIVFCAALIMIWGLTKRSYQSYMREVHHLQDLIERKEAAGKDTREEHRKLRRTYNEMRRGNLNQRRGQLARHDRERHGDFSYGPHPTHNYHPRPHNTHRPHSRRRRHR